jgi:glycosyltransferase involved in cell wall biosynthesis
MPGNKKRLLIEGWRSIPHSYALVNQFQILELLSRQEISIAHRDLPFSSRWRPTAGLFSAEQEALLASLPAPGARERFDAVYRIGFPFDLADSPRAERTVVFGTAEYGRALTASIAGGSPVAEAHWHSSAVIVTPSNWSRHGFLRAGAVAERCMVVPHGVDTQLFAPMDPAERKRLREAQGWEGFTFLTIGAATNNKGLDILLKALAIVSRSHPQVRLVVKGLDSMYDSDKLFAESKGRLTAQGIAQILPRIYYWGEATGMADMARMYNLADAYVAPYRAEGFGLPILEAAACGLPVICTAGGSSDDFVRDDFTMRISSQRVYTMSDEGPVMQLEANLDHLIELMTQAIEQPRIAERARAAGPQFVRENFTWRHVVDKLVDVLFPKS